jgi:hypothetical protein
MPVFRGRRASQEELRVAVSSNERSSLVSQIEAIRGELDRQLESALPIVGIMFGIELFKEFKQRGWFTLETFSVCGSTSFAEQLPAYRNTHAVYLSWGIPDLEFRVGNSG